MIAKRITGEHECKWFISSKADHAFCIHCDKKLYAWDLYQLWMNADEKRIDIMFKYLDPILKSSILDHINDCNPSEGDGECTCGFDDILHEWEKR